MTWQLFRLKRALRVWLNVPDVEDYAVFRRQVTAILDDLASVQRALDEQVIALNQKIQVSDAAIRTLALLQAKQEVEAMDHGNTGDAA